MKLRRDILLFGAVAIAAVVGGWWLLANRPGSAVEAYQQEHRRQEAAARAEPPPAEAFRATVCADTPCVVVEAGGLTFVFGAGNGAADGIRGLGLLHPNIDAVLLPDLSLRTVEGLAAIADGSAQVGRREPLRVYGPAGLLPVVDGANLMLSATRDARLAAGIEGENQGAYGRLVFDSGVVSVRGFGGSERGSGRVFRVDFDGRSLILAGCASLPTEIVTAAREVKTPAVVAYAGSERLGAPATACAEVTSVLRGIGQSKPAGSLVIPSAPEGAGQAAAAWRDVLADLKPEGTQLGTPGTVLDLTGDTPRVLTREQK